MLKKFFVSFMLITLISSLVLNNTSVNALSTNETNENLDLIVKYKTTASEQSHIQSIKPNLKKFTTSSRTDYDYLFKKLKNDSNIEIVQPNIKYKKSDLNNVSYKINNISVNDSYLSSQWYINNLNILNALDYNSGSNITVAVVDTGIDYNHEDLANKVIGGIDYTGTGSYNDNEGHGTHVAGTIAAISNNGKGVTGIAPSTKLLAVKVLDENGDGDTLSISQGIIWAADHGAKIINLSLGSASPDQILKSSINYASSKGIILVAAAGNDGLKNIYYPAAYDNVLSVGATNESNELASFSNFGDKIDLVAPGVNILSTVPSFYNNYEYMSGTSMATAVASGQFAILASNNPSLTVSSIKSNLKNYSFSNNATDKSYGAGIIDVTKAIAGQATTLKPVYNSITDNNTYTKAIDVNGSKELTGNTVAPFDSTWYKLSFNSNSTQVKLKFNSQTPLKLKADIFDSSLNLITELQNNYFSGSEYALSKGSNSYLYVKVYDDSGSSNNWTANFTYNTISLPENPITINYRTHIQKIGWQNYVSNGAISGTSGQSLRLEAMNINLSNAPSNMKIKYQTHIQNIGWQPWVYNGSLAGTSGLGLRMEALRISLENAPTGYHVLYQAHVERIGWQNWVQDGEMSGTSGRGLRVEAIRIKLVKDSDIVKITSQSNIQKIGWQTDSDPSSLVGTVGKSLRLEAIKLSLPTPPAGMKIKYQVHIQNIGWQNIAYDGTVAGTIGKGLRVEAIRIWFENAPNYTIQYQTHVSNKGWMDWVKNGETAGTTGLSLPVEGLRIRIINNN
ncbi:S8 family serine peptidase [Clostridium sp. YIM B02505]|uniref:S8 family serine peptidase n=1 Tax=Clostridium yunnanense TaxID=2800325 RepID=A0ABS1EP54_9CLOT|nr:S8 family serine peptidase [Clostridium yunnanense]MBK1811136.1 S8 family serine peptidase [Clostridium yunnanense]